ncbi:galectin-8-like, partial [Parasteatoda tepidariorum]|uniref:galectin-8-like n=1 Tax=Parasteatoda tepidariorum TaxID=114398 RepID=UPI0039BD6BA8
NIVCFLCFFRFTINLQTGTDPNNPPDIAFHFDVRFFNRTIVRNTRTCNSWQHEEKQSPSFPFSSDCRFDMMIRVTKDQYMVAVNGQHFIEFKHRLWPLSRFDTLYIESDISVQSIRFPVRMSSTVKNSPRTTNFSNPTSARTAIFPLIFTINLQAGTDPNNPPDIAFHFDVRFFNRTIVRNTRTCNSWQHEEKQSPSFPFSSDCRFDMMIRVTKDQYMVAVNGQHFIEFKHRLWPLSRFDTLYIESDISVQSIRFA